MISVDKDGKIFINRTNETKKKQIGKLMHNPKAKRNKPFIYINGLCLTAEDCKGITQAIEEMCGL